VILEIIRNYTREAGVRDLERQIEKVFRVIARDYLEGKEVKEISVENLDYYLGACRYKEYTEQIIKQAQEKGTAIGLAYTSVGGSIMLIECRY
jgi:ATP-dependent Lon protease